MNKEARGEVFRVFALASGAQRWRWRIRAANGRIIASSGESFTRQADAIRALTNVVQTIGAIAQRKTTGAGTTPLFEIAVFVDGKRDAVTKHVPCTA